ncbi:MAG: element excision factor XisI family protein [Scytonema sp. PMC 1069.18]|nr:element excision factor XisI family protein [Scytonema sp. PMC 1069.18]MEC4887711.1 element excision factor XisI family protein [Scytonema sp. PMC 1070.18]
MTANGRKGSSPSDEEAETELIFDIERDRYQVVHTGWKNRLERFFVSSIRGFQRFSRIHSTKIVPSCVPKIIRNLVSSS